MPFSIPFGNNCAIGIPDCAEAFDSMDCLAVCCDTSRAGVELLRSMAHSTKLPSALRTRRNANLPGRMPCFLTAGARWSLWMATELNSVATSPRFTRPHCAAADPSCTQHTMNPAGSSYSSSKPRVSSSATMSTRPTTSTLCIVCKMAHVGQAHWPLWKIDGVQANPHSTNSSIALPSHVGIGRFICETNVCNSCSAEHLLKISLKKQSSHRVLFVPIPVKIRPKP